MKKNYFLSLLLVIFAFNVNAQTGSIEIVSIPLSNAAGTSASITITYTSSVPCKITTQLRQTNANATTVDWGPWNGEVVTSLPAATNATHTISYPIPAGQTISTSLPSGVKYTFAFKMATTADVGFAWNDGATANLTTITAASGIQNSATITSAPTTVAAGESVIINYDYYLANAGKVKIDIRKYNGSTWLSTGLVVESYIDPAAASSTTVSGTQTLVIPVNTAISSSLASGENYKIAVTLYDASWTWILENKSDLTITAANLAINDFKLNEKITIVNPVGDELILNYKDLNAQTLRINDISGRIVKSFKNLNNFNSIDVSDLKQGIYFLTLNSNNAIKFIKK
ncbi:MAG: T9SS type A sorting domain-containing protein [Flavobacterium sp.]|nr:T9SS type A sorting domain-containing protein [Flavobacterium sp.]